MVRRVQGTKYRKVRGRPGRYRFSGRVHLVFWFYDTTYERYYWKYVCGKRQSSALEFDLNATNVPDSTPTTCVNCAKHAPEVVERMDVEDEVLSLDEFQPGGSQWVDDA